MKREGLNWEKSKERREEERTKMLEKDDRMKKAAGKKKAALEKVIYFIFALGKNNFYPRENIISITGTEKLQANL